jgi:hypothetical protein
MSRHEALSDWTRELSSHMSHLSKPQAAVLAMWSYGIAVTRTCSCYTVAMFLAILLKRKMNTVRQQLREWCYDGADKRGTRRQQLDVEASFAPLLRWVVHVWVGTTMALAMDATSLGDRFVVLSISVVYRGMGIPVAWTVLTAQRKGAWREHWLRILEQVRPALPAEWTVLVLADRGMYARWLYRRIVRLGWHPFLRINQRAKFQPAGQQHWYWLTELLSQVGTCWQGEGTAFSSKDHHQRCTLVAWWGEGHEEAWFIITDLPSEGCQATWYALRAWCEQGFKCIKRGGWQWQHTRMSDPARVTRLWLALAVATLWMVSLGSDLEVGPSPELPDLPDLRPILAIAVTTIRQRRTRLFRLGWLWLIVQLITSQPLPLPQRLIPEPWPEAPPGWTPVSPLPQAQETYP